MSKPPVLTDATLDVNDGVALLTFDRDDVRNALTGTALVGEIIKVIDWVNSNHSVGAMIITGGGKAFSSGGNVKHMLNKVGLFSGTPLEIQDKYRRGLQLVQV
jgi:enoyl-CoA hydratase/carnithine racemase